MRRTGEGTWKPPFNSPGPGTNQDQKQSLRAALNYAVWGGAPKSAVLFHLPLTMPGRHSSQLGQYTQRLEQRAAVLSSTLAG